MSRASIAIARKEQQLPQFNYNWYALLPTLPILQGVTLTPPEFTTLGGMEELNHRITNIDAPNPSFDTNKNTIGPAFFYTASNKDIGSMTINIDEYEDGLTMQYFMAWQELMGDVNNSLFFSQASSYRGKTGGFYMPPAFYKRTLTIFRTTSSGDAVHKTMFHGCFPTNISNIAYNYEDGGIMSYSVTFAGDSVEHEFLPAADVKAIVDSAQPKLTGRREQKKGNGVNLAQAVAVASLVKGLKW